MRTTESNTWYHDYCSKNCGRIEEMENWEMKNDRKIRLYKVSLISLEDLFFFEYLILKKPSM